MQLLNEILNTIVSITVIAQFILGVWQEYKHQRMTRDKKEKDW